MIHVRPFAATSSNCINFRYIDLINFPHMDNVFLLLGGLLVFYVSHCDF